MFVGRNCFLGLEGCSTKSVSPLVTRTTGEPLMTLKLTIPHMTLFSKSLYLEENGKRFRWKPVEIIFTRNLIAFPLPYDTRTRLLSPQNFLTTLFPRSILFLNCKSERNFVGVRARLSTCHKITNYPEQLLLCLLFINRKTNSKRKPFFKTQSETINYIIQQQ